MLLPLQPFTIVLAFRNGRWLSIIAMSSPAIASLNGGDFCSGNLVSRCLVSFSDDIVLI
jgi:hypothetical protein